MSLNSNASSRQWATYLDIDDDVAPWLQIPAARLEADPTISPRLSLVTDSVCSWVQNFLGRPVAPTQFDARFDGWTGWRGSYLMLPEYPVLEVVSVTEYWGINGPHVLSESTPIHQVDGFQVRPLTGRLTRVFTGNVAKPWFPGSGNVEIVWVAGYNPVPPDIRLATLEMIAHWWRNTQQRAATGPGVGSGGGGHDSGGATLWTGVPNRVIDMLEPYLRQGIG